MDSINVLSEYGLNQFCIDLIYSQLALLGPRPAPLGLRTATSSMATARQIAKRCSLHGFWLTDNIQCLNT
jgi:hypothetical protein